MVLVPAKPMDSGQEKTPVVKVQTIRGGRGGGGGGTLAPAPHSQALGLLSAYTMHHKIEDAWLPV